MNRKTSLGLLVLVIALTGCFVLSALLIALKKKNRQKVYSSPSAAVLEEKRINAQKAKSDIRFITFSTDAESGQIKVPFLKNNEQAGTVIFDTYFKMVESCHIECTDTTTLLKENPSTPFLIDTGGLREIAMVILDSSQTERVLAVIEDGGTGSGYTHLNIIRPEDAEIVSMALSWDYTKTDYNPQLTWSENAGKPSFAAERKFLESILYAYGYISEDDILAQQDNPEFALHFWGKDNGAVTNGPMKIRKYKGKCDIRSSITYSLADGNITYTACFKGPVIAYDSSVDEYYILFHPYNHYSWPTVLKKAGPLLIIGTRGEGLAVVNTDNFHLKRIETKDSDVAQIDLAGPKIILNSSEELELSSLTEGS